ncbi:malonyl-ACP O-methyltransferase BioC [Candidatus Providencia siddallii]|uniref:Malonyl-[acyl-carrier protein] O-methyltransferase n=1 Tax=Candidatus Providencia siddallii TaxID=1715285 RepID=A0ABM9NNG8_9GAMM
MTLFLCHKKQKIAAAFSKAASKYDLIANYQQYIGDILLYKLEFELKKTKKNGIINVLDAGCGTGFFSKIMKKRGLNVTALDLSSGMLEIAKNKNAACSYLCADIESIPIENNTFDIVFSNLAIQWCQDFTKALIEFYRVTKIGGIILFTTLAENTLIELSKAWRKIDNFQHVNNFLSYTEIVKNCEIYRNKLFIQKDTLYFYDLNTLLYSLKGVGATYLISNRKSKLITRKSFKRLSDVYPKKKHKFPLTYYTVFGTLYCD